MAGPRGPAGKRSRPMARNRKYQSAAIRFGPALKALLLCILIGGSGVGYVWQKNQIYQLGQEIKKREVCLDKLEDQNEKNRRQLGIMRGPQFLERRIKELNLGLAPAQPSQVWRLTEAVPEGSRSSAQRARDVQDSLAAVP
jgi:hypothetical protein